MKGKKPGSEYKKIPVVDIGPNVQINDSFIVVKTLAPILQGRPLTDEELQLEEMNTYGVMVRDAFSRVQMVSALCSRCARRSPWRRL